MRGGGGYSKRCRGWICSKTVAAAPTSPGTDAAAFCDTSYSRQQHKYTRTERRRPTPVYGAFRAWPVWALTTRLCMARTGPAQTRGFGLSVQRMGSIRGRQKGQQANQTEPSEVHAAGHGYDRLSP